MEMSLDVVVSLETGYRLGIQVTVILFLRQKTFYLLETIQTGSGAHTVAYSLGHVVCIPGHKAATAKSWPLTTILY
jgi:hypothetical protein